MKACRREIVDPAIAQHGGRIVKTTGDGLLVEFASAVEAVTSAMALQGEMSRRAGQLGAPITFRIGINVGDVILVVTSTLILNELLNPPLQFKICRRLFCLDHATRIAA